MNKQKGEEKMKKGITKKEVDKIIADLEIDRDDFEIITEGKHRLSGNIRAVILGGDVVIDGMTDGEVHIFTNCEPINQSGGVCYFGHFSGRNTISKNRKSGVCSDYRRMPGDK